MKFLKIPGWSQVARFPQLRFHLSMAVACAGFFLFSFVGRHLVSTSDPFASAEVIVPLLVLAGTGWLPLYWNEKGKATLRDAAATLPWAVLLKLLLQMVVVVAGRLGMHRPLSDSLFVHLDRSLGVSVPNLMTWSRGNRLGGLIDGSYPLLAAWLPIAALLPALTGKARQAQEFLVANAAAFAIGVPLFAMWPAVGPWYGLHLPSTPLQQACQQALLSLRDPGPFVYESAGVICFPSFHVIWAILCARAMWGYRWLRVPSLLLSGMIVVSTMTTGWHYFVDVLGGCAVAAFSMMVATAAVRERDEKRVSKTSASPVAVAMIERMLES